jgi:hypothetical protein
MQTRLWHVLGIIILWGAALVIIWDLFSPILVLVRRLLRG